MFLPLHPSHFSQSNQFFIDIFFLVEQLVCLRNISHFWSRMGCEYGHGFSRWL